MLAWEFVFCQIGIRQTDGDIIQHRKLIMMSNAVKFTFDVKW